MLAPIIGGKRRRPMYEAGQDTENNGAHEVAVVEDGVEVIVGKQNRRGVRFSLRVSFKRNMEPTTYIRQSLLNLFSSKPGYQLRSWVIALEKNLQTGAKSLMHIQSALVFEQPHTYNEVKEVVMEGYGGLLAGVYVGGINTLRNFRLYCSKEDGWGLNRGPVKELSAYYRTVNYLRLHREIRYSSSHVFSLRNSILYLRLVLEELEEHSKPPYAGLQYQKIVPSGWPLEVCEHLQMFSRETHRSVRSRRHVVLSGPPNTGKSTLVRLLFNDYDFRHRVFTPRDTSTFYLSGLNDSYEVILLDEFSLKNDYLGRSGQLNKLLSGDMLKIDVKCYPIPNEIVWKKPVIIVTNEDCSGWPNPLITRLKVVRCERHVGDIVSEYCSNAGVPQDAYNEEQVVCEHEVARVDCQLEDLRKLAHNERIQYDRSLVLDPSLNCPYQGDGPDTEANDNVEDIQEVLNMSITNNNVDHCGRTEVNGQVDTNVLVTSTTDLRCGNSEVRETMTVAVTTPVRDQTLTVSLNRSAQMSNGRKRTSRSLFNTTMDSDVDVGTPCKTSTPKSNCSRSSSRSSRRHPQPISVTNCTINLITNPVPGCSGWGQTTEQEKE